MNQYTHATTLLLLPFHRVVLLLNVLAFTLMFFRSVWLQWMSQACCAVQIYSKCSNTDFLYQALLLMTGQWWTLFYSTEVSIIFFVIKVVWQFLYFHCLSNRGNNRNLIPMWKVLLNPKYRLWYHPTSWHRQYAAFSALYNPLTICPHTYVL